MKVAIQIIKSNIHGHKVWGSFALVLLITFFRLQDLDDAVLRRFSKRIYVRLPGKDDRVQMLLKLLSKQYNDLSIHEVHQVGRSS